MQKTRALTTCSQQSRKRKETRVKKSELSAYIATLLLKELRDSDRNLSECEKILHDSLELLKNVTLDNSILQMKKEVGM